MGRTATGLRGAKNAPTNEDLTRVGLEDPRAIRPYAPRPYRPIPRGHKFNQYFLYFNLNIYFVLNRNRRLSADEEPDVGK
jgi:hypothetical protein